MVLPVWTLVATLVANWIASENITGLTGEVACGHLMPKMMQDPIGVALCLACLGVLVAPSAGSCSSMTEIIIEHYGKAVGTIAGALCVVGSLLWAAAQYKAILALTQSLGVAEWSVEFAVPAILLCWTLVGGLVADVWLDFVSMLLMVPSILCVGVMSFWSIPASVWTEELAHGLRSLHSKSAAGNLAIGAFGNLFTEELAGRVLLAESPAKARKACFSAALLFGIVGMAPALLGLYARNPQILKISEETLCTEKQDQVASVALKHLLHGASSQFFVALLILESLNTVDTSILMCAKVLETYTTRMIPAAKAHARALEVVGAAVSLTAVATIAMLGENTWELAERASKLVGAPLAIPCIFLRWRPSAKAALVGGCLAQAVYLWLDRYGLPLGVSGGSSGHNDGMPFVWAILLGSLAYIATVFACGDCKGHVKNN